MSCSFTLWWTFANSTPQLASLWHVGGGSTFIGDSLDDAKHSTADFPTALGILMLKVLRATPLRMPGA